LGGEGSEAVNVTLISLVRHRDKLDKLEWRQNCKRGRAPATERTETETATGGPTVSSIPLEVSYFAPDRLTKFVQLRSGQNDIQFRQLQKPLLDYAVFVFML
jgi:hypothetical protein